MTRCDCILCRTAPYLGIALVLAACPPQIPKLDAFERQAVHAADLGWNAAGLPTKRGDCVLSKTSIRHTEDDRELFARCRGIPYACLNWESDGDWFRPERFPVVVLAPGKPVLEDGEPIIHELMHALFHCTDRPGRYGPANLKHLDPQVWHAAGGDRSAQGRARSLMTLVPFPE